MIRLITGDPGAGKSLRGVEYLCEAVTTGRPVYQAGVNGLVPELGVKECDPRNWESLPDGSIIVIDEAQDVWPTRTGATVPPDIRALSKHRHRGFDFVLLTQRPTFLDIYVRELAGSHEHVFRQFGTGIAKIITWPGVEEKPRSPSSMARGTESYWKYDKSLYSLYTSATLHTVKAKIPLKMKVIPALLLIVCVLAYFSVRALHGITDVVPAPEEATAGTPKSLLESVTAGPGKGAIMTTEDYVKSRIPRIASDPGSAPVFDGREPVSKPELYCIAREDLYCVCLTEQGTRYAIERKECLSIARNGIYNPFRAPAETAAAASAVPLDTRAVPTVISPSSIEPAHFRARRRIDAASVVPPSLPDNGALGS